MRTAITLGILPDGSGKPLAGPEVPIHEQKAAIKRRELKDEGFAEVQLWESGTGITKRYTPAVVKAREERRAAQNPPPKKQAAPKSDYAAELAKLDDIKLAEVVVQFEVVLPSGADRASTIAAILAKAAELDKAAV